MTFEERKGIAVVKDLIDEYKYSEETEGYEWGNEIKGLETVLNLIKEQQEKIEDCKKCFIRDNLHICIEEIEKQDKMIKYLVKETIELDEVGFTECNGCKNNDGIYKSENEKCIECRKIYYGKKVGYIK